ncbi:MAG: histidine--tRNA ligase [Eubacterium sp.]|nr:histidine--tRNA ligase [Eubacterium sp.]
MSMKKKPVTGMKDILPREMEIRDYAIGLIKETYKKFGFTSVETPCIEHIENLSSKQGGENEKLIFKILKRGEKLRLEEATSAADLVDGGLRYDLTVPLSRYYSNNVNDLPSPFKALQMGNVWRADRPQKGRYRQFMQCDIDILGEPTNIAEIELILATSTLLGKLDFKKFTIRINDRRILRAMVDYAGFVPVVPQADSDGAEGAATSDAPVAVDYDGIFIILDKMDKIGLDGVREELIGAGNSSEIVDKYLELFDKVTPDVEGIRFLKDTLGDFLDESVTDGLSFIIENVEAAKESDFKMAFDPTLVRGMSYYTGPIFEISMDEYGSAVGGGGRYDEMIGRFTGSPTPACGFSIGFERIVMLLLERDFKVPGSTSKTAFMVEKNMPADKMSKIMALAKERRSTGECINVVMMKKNKKFQKDQLTAEGYTDIVEFFADREI